MNTTSHSVTLDTGNDIWKHADLEPVVGKVKLYAARAAHWLHCDNCKPKIMQRDGQQEFLGVCSLLVEAARRLHNGDIDTLLLKYPGLPGSSFEMQAYLYFMAAFVDAAEDAVQQFKGVAQTTSEPAYTKVEDVGSQSSPPHHQELNENSKEALLKVVWLLKKKFYSEVDSRKLVSTVKSDLEILGQELSEKTIRKYLGEAETLFDT